jgi:hypothetical protein
LFSQHGDDVQFLLVYIREAHPKDGWQVPRNEDEGVVFSQPETLEQRSSICQQMCEKLELTIPAVIDGMDNAVNQAYNAWPDRLYLIDAKGRIAHQGGRGPRGFDPDGLATAILHQLDR